MRERNLWRKLLATALICLPSLVQAAETKPNVLMIVADDMGYSDLGSYGGRMAQTPNIDSLAEQGLRFTNAYANASVCSPSRLALITGGYPGRLRVGLEEPIATRTDVGLEAGTPTIARAFQLAGYQTSLIGKYHLGAPPAFKPEAVGYDVFFGIHAGGTDYFKHQFTLFGREMGHLYEGDTRSQKSGYITDLFTARAIAEIDSAQSAGKPFFMSLHYTSPHWPWEGPKDHDVIPESPQHFTGGSMATYTALVEDLDTAVGEVLDHLDAQGLSDNTIVIFGSDNGGERFSDNWPLIGMKAELLEGGIRIPLIVRWPGHTPENGESEQVISWMDFYPTFASLLDFKAGVAETMDGIDLSGALSDATSVTERTLFWRHKGNNQKAMREGSWKYVSLNGAEFLFNLDSDPRERANLATVFPERFSAMKASFAAWEKAMLPYPDDNYSHTLKGDKYADHYLSLTHDNN